VYQHPKKMFRRLDALLPESLKYGKVAARNPTKFNNRLATVTSILCYSQASEGSNKFPRVFGAFLQSNGVKRRVLDPLHQFGLSEGYKGVHKHLETVAQQAKVVVPGPTPSNAADGREGNCL
jgi:hypothetical protein